MKNIKETEYIPLSEAAKYTPYSAEYLSLRARQGKLRAIKVGKIWVTKREWVEEYVRKYQGKEETVKLPTSFFKLPTFKLRFEILFALTLLLFFVSFALAKDSLKIVAKEIVSSLEEIGEDFVIGANLQFSKTGKSFKNVFSQRKEGAEIALAETSQTTQKGLASVSEFFKEYFQWLGEKITKPFKKEKKAEEVKKAEVQKEITIPKEVQEKISSLEEKIKELERKPPLVREIEVERKVVVEPIKRVEVEKITEFIPSEELAKIKSQLSIFGETLRKIQPNPPYTTALTSPIYIQQGIQGGAGIFASLAAESAAFRTLGVGASVTLGSDSRDKLTVNSVSQFNAPITVGQNALTIDTSGNIKTQGSAEIAGNLITQGLTEFKSPFTLTSTSTPQLSIRYDELNKLDISVFSTGAVNVSSTATTTLFAAGNANQLVLGSNGNIGIGTTTPPYKLTVNGDLYVSATSTLGSATSTPVIFGGYVQSNIIPYFDNQYTLGLSNYRWANIFAATGTFGGTITIGTNTIEGSATTTLFTSGNANQLVLGANGNVGIGEATLSQKLTVSGGILATGNLTIQGLTNLATTTISTQLSVPLITSPSTLTISPSSNATTTITGPVILASQTGNVGIGTTAPSQKLTVAGNIGIQAGANAFIGTLDNFALSLRTNNTDRIFITNTGNVGIGTTAPSLNLEVSGNVNTWVVAGVRNLSSGSNAWSEFRLGNDTASNKLVMVCNSSNRTVDGGAGNCTIRTDSGLLHLSAGGGQKVTIDTTGNVGIGTTAPNYKLTVSGGDIYGSNNLYIAGNVGIGTTTIDAGTKLQVEGGIISIKSSGDARIQFTQLTSNEVGWIGIPNWANHRLYIYGPNGTGGNEWVMFYDGSNKQLAFATGATQRITIDSSGNVGIGTTAPSYKLDVAGNARVGNLYLADNGNILYSGNSQTSIRLSRTDASNTNYGPYIQLGSNDANRFFIQPLYDANGYITDVAFRSLTDATISTFTFMPDSVSTLTLTSAGNVGIGTTAPANKLDIRGGGVFISGPGNNPGGGIGGLLLGYDTTNNFATIDAGQWGVANQDIRVGTLALKNFIIAQGNVGIGTTAPVSLLELYKTDASPILTITSATSTTYSPQIAFRTGATPTTNFTLGVDISTGKLKIVPSSDITTSTGITIDSSGNVGIGTTAPNYKLDVSAAFSGTAMARLYSSGNEASLRYETPSGAQWHVGKYQGNDSFFFWNTVGGTVATILSNGNVGIGTTTPSEKLIVIGNIAADRLRIKGTDGNYFNVVHGAATAPNQHIHFVADYVKQSGATDVTTFFGYNSEIKAYDWCSKWTGTNNCNLMYIDASTGNVGIGTTAPISTLHIKGTTNAPLTIDRKDNSGTTNSLIMLRDETGAEKFALNIETNPNGVPLFWDKFDGTWKSSIALRGGNVGIGTTAPSEKLTVTGGNILITDGDAIFSSGNAKVSQNGLFICHDIDCTLTAATPTGVGIIINRSNPGIVVKNIGGPAAIFESGNVGIGTTAPVSLLELYKTDASPILTITAATSTTYSPQIAFRTGATPTTNFTLGVDISTGKLKIVPSSDITTSTGITIDSSGNVGIGTTSPGAKLHVASTGEAIRIMPNTMGRGEYASIFFRDPDGGTGPMEIRYTDDGSPDLAILGGNVGIGTTAPDYKLDVQGPIRQTNATNCALSADANGQIICTVSSQRYKTNIRNLDFDIEKFLSLNPRAFDWNTSTINFVPGEKSSVGFIAEEVEKIFPELVRYRNGIPEGIKYEILPVYMFKVIQEQQKEIEKLKLAINENGNLTQNGQEILNFQPTSSLTETIKQLLENLGLILENGIAKVKEIVTEKLTAEVVVTKEIKTERITTNEIQIVDKATGEIYCTWIENGEWVKVKGECESLTSQPVTNNEQPASNETTKSVATSSEQQTANNEIASNEQLSNEQSSTTTSSTVSSQ